MKILAVDKATNKPLTNSKIQLQVRSKDSGFLSANTDTSGYFQLDEKYKGQQIANSLSGNTDGAGEWLTASDGAKLLINTKTAGTSTTGTGGTGSAGGTKQTI